MRVNKQKRKSMKTKLKKIQELAKQGVELSLANGGAEYKDIYLAIYCETSLLLEMMESKSSRDLTPSTRNKSKCDIDNMHKIAFYFSRYGHEDLYPNQTQGAAFECVAEKLGIKKNTFKNTRDYFDGLYSFMHPDDMTRSRKGWDFNGTVPPQQMEKIKKYEEQYSCVSRGELLDEIRTILELN